MSIKKTIEKVKKGIDEEVYKMVRLIKKEKKGNKIEDNVLIPYSKMGKQHCIARLNHIKHELENDLPPGKYIIQVCMGSTKTAMKKNFEVEVYAPIKVLHSRTQHSPSVEVDDKTEETTDNNMNGFVSIEEYKKMLQEISNLKMQLHVLMTENEMLNREISRLDSGGRGIGDGSGNTFAETAFKTLSDMAPGIMNVVDKFLEQRDRRLDLDERKLNKVKVNRSNVQQQQMTREELADYIDDLFDKDEARANMELDKIKQSDPDTYNWLWDELGLVDDNEPEE
jgi:hypothetical protein